MRCRSRPLAETQVLWAKALWVARTNTKLGTQTAPSTGDFSNSVAIAWKSRSAVRRRATDLLQSRLRSMGAEGAGGRHNDSMEHVKMACPGLQWEPNDAVPPTLSVSDGTVRLQLGPHPADQDHRSVILTFQAMRHMTIGFPNDESRDHHRLWNQGLSDINWIGAVDESALVDAVHRSSALPPRLTHWVVLLKEQTVEVVAEDVDVTRG